MSKLQVDDIVNKDDNGSVGFSRGAVVTGATSFQGTTTFDNGFSVTGSTGIVTATGFVGPVTGDVTGNLTGNVTGNVTGNTSGSAGSLAAGATGADLTLSGNLTVNGTTTTIDTAVTAVDSLAVDGEITTGGKPVATTGKAIAMAMVFGG